MVYSIESHYDEAQKQSVWLVLWNYDGVAEVVAEARTAKQARHYIAMAYGK